MPLETVQSLRRIDAWIARSYPDRLPFLRPGADAATLERIEAKLSIALPPIVCALYRAHDGQPEGTPSLFLNQRWLPLDLVAVAWEDLCLRYGAIGGARLGRERAVWSASWLPLFGSPRGDHYCLDLGPERTGQLIWFLYDQPERAVVARSMTDLLRRVADGLRSGEWDLDDGYDGLSD